MHIVFKSQLDSLDSTPCPKGDLILRVVSTNECIFLIFKFSKLSKANLWNRTIGSHLNLRRWTVKVIHVRIISKGLRQENKVGK